MGLAGVLGLLLTFAGIAAVSRALSPPPVPAATTPPAVPASPATATASPSSAIPSPLASPTVTAPQDQVDVAAIESVAERFVDAWLQRDLSKRQIQLAATATEELAAALMETADQNIPRTSRTGEAAIESRAGGVAIVLQNLADTTVLRLTVVQSGGSQTWLVSSVDMAAG